MGEVAWVRLVGEQETHSVVNIMTIKAMRLNVDAGVGRVGERW